MDFNKSIPRVMHIDINSAFATIEQQYNDDYRNKPLVVAAYSSPGGTILAASVDAKKLGIKTGMRVFEAKAICNDLIVLEPDPPKYRTVHKKLFKLLKKYTNVVFPKSIDEFVLDFKDYEQVAPDLIKTAIDIKKAIKEKVGDYITVSIGIGTNRFLAKTASNLKKPDGLNEINMNNHLDVYRELELVDLTGIARRNEVRLRTVGINSVIDFYNASISRLKIAFGGIAGYYWWLRLKGYEIDAAKTQRRTFGNSYAFPNPNLDPLPILQKLCEKTGTRLRNGNYKATGVHLAISYKDRSHWHKGYSLKRDIFDSRDIYREMVRLMQKAPKKGIHILAESVFDLKKQSYVQNELFEDINRKKSLVDAVDDVNNRWGEFVISPARMIMAKGLVKDRIAFGK